MNLKAIATPLGKSETIDSLADGKLFLLPRLAFRTPNVFSTIAFLPSLVVKLPTEAWLEDFRRFVLWGEDWQTGVSLVRGADAEERDVAGLVLRFPELRSCYDKFPDHAHFLLVHRLQYERLSTAPHIRIPRSCYVLVLRRRFLLPDLLIPAVIQERVPGIPLLDMYDQGVRAVRPEWRQALPRLRPVLLGLLESDLRDHLNWFIRNFVYDPRCDSLAYVDVKPSCLFARYGNEKNIESLRRFFL